MARQHGTRQPAPGHRDGTTRSPASYPTRAKDRQSSEVWCRRRGSEESGTNAPFWPGACATRLQHATPFGSWLQGPGVNLHRATAMKPWKTSSATNEPRNACPCFSPCILSWQEALNASGSRRACRMAISRNACPCPAPVSGEPRPPVPNWPFFFFKRLSLTVLSKRFSLTLFTDFSKRLSLTALVRKHIIPLCQALLRNRPAKSDRWWNTRWDTNGRHHGHPGQRGSPAAHAGGGVRAFAWRCSTGRSTWTTPALRGRT